LDESPTRKKTTAGGQPMGKTPRPLECDDQSSFTEQRSTSTDPEMLFRSAAKNDMDKLKFGSSATDSPILPSLNNFPPPVNTECILPVQVSLDQTASEGLDYIQHKTNAKNITMEIFNFTYAKDTSSFKISVPSELFSTICSADFWPAFMVEKKFKTRNKNTSKRKRTLVTRLPSQSSVAPASSILAPS